MGRVKGKGRAAKKTKQIQLQRGEDEDVKNAPHSFVIHRGKVGQSVLKLTSNFRKVMAPFTAEKLKVQKVNKLKDFVALAGPLKVSHLVMFTKSDNSVNMRICRLPRGPTLHFQVNSYSLISDLAHHIRRHDVNDSHFKHHALLVMNNFSKDVNHLKLTASMFQNMFPSLNINKVQLRTIKRVALVNYIEETDTIEFRHYTLRVVPLGVSKSVKKLQKKTVPKLEKYDDISQFLLNPGALSDSEAEVDGEHNTLQLPQKLSGVGNTQNDQSAIRLKEIGPRMTMTLTKITEGICDGEPLYHKFDTLTEEQKQDIKKRKEERRKLKAQRTAEQNERVRMKKLAKEQQKEKSRQQQAQSEAAGDKKGNKMNVQAEDMEDSDDYRSADENADSDDDINDAEYYEQEVGAKPDKELFSETKKKSFPVKRPAYKSKTDSTPAKRKFQPTSAQTRGKEKTTPRKPGQKQFKTGKKPQRSATKTFTGGAKARANKHSAGDKSKAKFNKKRKVGK